MAENYNSHSDTLISPWSREEAVTPHDINLIADGPAKALYVGVGGDITLASLGNKLGPVQFKNVASGTILPCRATRVLATGTTATNIVALF